MPVNDFNVGRDVAFNIFDNNQNALISLNIVTGFDRKQETHEVKIKGIDGVVRYAFLPDGWKGMIELDRADATADNFFAYLEGLYYDGQNVVAGQITETITEVDGSVTEWTYQRAVFKLADAGSVKGDTEIKMKIEFAASRRVRTA